MLLYIDNNSGSVAHELLQDIRDILALMGLHNASSGIYDKWIYFAVVVIGSFLAMFVLSKLSSFVLQHILQHRKGAFWNNLYQSQFITRLLWLIPPISMHLMLPFAFAGVLLTSLQRMCMIALVWVMVCATNTFISLLWEAFYQHSRMRDRPMKGILQIIHGVFIALGCIITVSILINRSPTALITGLGAFAAILLLIFKDTILGFVAGIQLAQYDMVRNGDWITIPGTIVDGVVSDVSLNTVKVRNYDNTLIMLPPYTLVSQPIQNWRGMKESGGRRIMQSIIIDLYSVQFCTPALMARLFTHAVITEFVEQNGIIIYDPLSDTAPHEALDNKHVGTNLALFRQYLTHYLTQHPDIQHQGYTLMTRTLQPDGNGIPLQLYCFTNTTHWESYEIIQSHIMEYTVAIMPLFELHPFQNASARDYIAQSLVSQGYKPEEIGAIGM